VAHTGGIISSCGVIMAGTFLAMLFGSLTTLKQLGFALGVGVLLDTFIVRPVLVPAFVVLYHRLRPGVKLDAPVAHEPSPVESDEHETIGAAAGPAGNGKHADVPAVPRPVVIQRFAGGHRAAEGR
jgi:hypothetical protein